MNDDARLLEAGKIALEAAARAFDALDRTARLNGDEIAAFLRAMADNVQEVDAP